MSDPGRMRTGNVYNEASMIRIQKVMRQAMIQILTETAMQIRRINRTSKVNIFSTSSSLSIRHIIG